MVCSLGGKLMQLWHRSPRVGLATALASVRWLGGLATRITRDRFPQVMEVAESASIHHRNLTSKSGQYPIKNRTSRRVGSRNNH